MIGTELYTLTSFEIIVGGIVMFVLGAIAAIVLIAFVIVALTDGIKDEIDKRDSYSERYTETES